VAHFPFYVQESLTLFGFAAPLAESFCFSCSGRNIPGRQVRSFWVPAVTFLLSGKGGCFLISFQKYDDKPPENSKMSPLCVKIIF
jgi:hypothetical protein